MVKKRSIGKTLASMVKIKAYRFNLTLVFFSLIIGIFSSLVVISYILTIQYVQDLRDSILNDRAPFWVVAVMLFVIIAAGLIAQKFVSIAPSIGGSGIPQVGAFLIKKLKFEFPVQLIGKFVGGVCAIAAGMSFGREGPSIHMGALIGDAINKLTKRSAIGSKYFITCGAGAGLAAAFNAPLAGIMFALEELYKFFSPVLMLCVLVATVTSDYVTRAVLGGRSLFNFSVTSRNLPFVEHLPLLIFFAVILTVLGRLFAHGIILFKAKYESLKVNSYIKIVLVMLIAFIVLRSCYYITGGGHNLITKLFHESTPLRLLLLLFLGKFIYSLFCYSSGLPGGIFLPTLTIGALLGNIYGITAVRLLGLPNEFMGTFIILGMSSYLTAVIKAPLTSIILMLELTGNFANLFPLVLITAITYIFLEMVNGRSVYEMLLEYSYIRKPIDAKEAKTSKA